MQTVIKGDYPRKSSVYFIPMIDMKSIDPLGYLLCCQSDKEIQSRSAFRGEGDTSPALKKKSVLEEAFSPVTQC